MKQCLYCGDLINKENEFEKIGRKYVCLLCYDDYLSDDVGENFNYEDDYYEDNVEDF